MTTLRATAMDGRPLGTTVIEPASRAPAPDVVLIASATGVRRAFYDRFARFLADAGFVAVTFDYRGIGDSRGRSLRGFEARMRDWGERDLAGVIDWVGGRYPGSRLLLVGHSVGGQLVGLARNASQIGGILMVGAQSGWRGHWPVPRRYLYAVLWKVVIPVLTGGLGYFPSKRLQLGEDLPAGVAREWAKWCSNPNYMIDDAGAPLRPHFGDFRGRLVAVSIADDVFAPRAAVDALVGWYTNAHVQREHFDARALGLGALGHFGFFRERAREALWGRVVGWLRSM